MKKKKKCWIKHHCLYSTEKRQIVNKSVNEDNGETDTKCVTKKTSKTTAGCNKAVEA